MTRVVETITPLFQTPTSFRSYHNPTENIMLSTTTIKFIRGFTQDPPEVHSASQTNSSVPSSSVMEMRDSDTPMLNGSPVSSHTSLSVASTKDCNDVDSTDYPRAHQTNLSWSHHYHIDTAVPPPPQLVPSTLTLTPTYMPVAPVPNTRSSHKIPGLTPPQFSS